MEELTNFDILEIFPLFKINLIACIDHRDLYKYDLKDGSYVLNLGNKHWVALFVKNEQGVYFDSYGEIYPQSVELFCPDLIYNDDNIQSLNSILCGYCCLFFLYWMTNKYKFDLKYTLTKFRALFSDYERLNDKILQSHVKKLISH